MGHLRADPICPQVIVSERFCATVMPE